MRYTERLHSFKKGEKKDNFFVIYIIFFLYYNFLI